MKRELIWIESLKIGLIIALTGSILFLIIEVAWAQILKDTLISNYEGETNLLTFLILIGFLASVLISLIVGEIVSNQMNGMYAFYATLITFPLNLVIWISIAYLTVLDQYPTLISALDPWEKLIVFPRVLSYFAIYILGNVTWLWIPSQITYGLLFSSSLMMLGASTEEGYGYSTGAI